ncbi:MAG: HDIG domain-containing protein, partial [Euryarchaeota archaeon]|nr:HDIG domain-containing protein [Euryarchaeota archaeon]
MNQEDCIHLLKKAGCSPAVIEHSLAVAEYAREIAMRYNERRSNHVNLANTTDPANPADQADLGLVTAGALLHDVGRARSNGINHAVIGAEIARSFGLDATIVRIIERHIGSGIPPGEAVQIGLPAGDY